MSFWNGNEWVGEAPAAKPASRAKRIAAAALEASLITALTFGLIAGTTFAAKGSHGSGGGSTTGGGTIALASPLVYDANANTLPNYGDVVTFNVSTTATTTPYVNLQCFQNGASVYNSWNGYFVGALNATWNFGLASGAWQGGAATCTAWLDMYAKNGSWTKLASASFNVGA
jgi:hypothetical protein